MQTLSSPWYEIGPFLYRICPKSSLNDVLQLTALIVPGRGQGGWELWAEDLNFEKRPIPIACRKLLTHSYSPGRGTYCNLAEKNIGQILGKRFVFPISVKLSKNGSETINMLRKAYGEGAMKTSQLSRGFGKVGSLPATKTARDARRDHKRTTRCKKYVKFWTKTDY